jgi:hypothetical protein
VTGTPQTFQPNGTVGAVVVAIASCDAGHTVVGGGAIITGNNVNTAIAVLTASYPTPNGSTWVAVATEVIRNANGSGPSLTAFALCTP